MTRYFQGAWQDLQWISGRAPEFRERHQEIMDEGRNDAAAESNWVHEHKRAAIFFATWGEPEQALRLVEEVVEGRPGTAWLVEVQSRPPR